MRIQRPGHNVSQMQLYCFGNSILHNKMFGVKVELYSRSRAHCNCRTSWNLSAMHFIVFLSHKLAPSFEYSLILLACVCHLYNLKALRENVYQWLDWCIMFCFSKRLWRITFEISVYGGYLRLAWDVSVYLNVRMCACACLC